MEISEDARLIQIRDLNDRLRWAGVGGKIMVTRGLSSLGAATVSQVLDAVRTFDAFCGDNDPYGEHDCATVVVNGLRVIWKIDYYDKIMVKGSPDPADPTVTTRVLTVMRAEEY